MATFYACIACVFMSFLCWRRIDRNFSVNVAQTGPHENYMSLLNIAIVLVGYLYAVTTGNLTGWISKTVLYSIIGYNLMDILHCVEQKEWHFVAHHLMAITIAALLLYDPSSHMRMLWLTGPIEFTSLLYNVEMLHRIGVLVVPWHIRAINFGLYAILRWYITVLMCTAWWSYPASMGLQRWWMAFPAVGLATFSFISPFVLGMHFVR